MNFLDFHELFDLLQNGDETDRIEAKSAASGIGKSFLQTVSAFSNEPDLGGGYILLGVSRSDKEPRYATTGVSNPDQLQQTIASQCRELFSAPIRPIIKTILHPQGTIILVYVSEASSHEKPIYIKKQGIEAGCYRRIGSTDQLCTRDDLDLLYQLRSKKKYDEYLIEEASFADFEPDAIKWYRYERAKIKPDAPELRYSDEDLMKSMRAIDTEKGMTRPTGAGILLFGKQQSLRRFFGLTYLIDYMLVEGREWITNSEKRYAAFEMNEALITGIPRLINQIMTDIPQVFALDEEQIRRIDNPIIPRKVIREAVVNAIMHKDYRVVSPTQIIKYANRIEFRNVGYSLKPQEELGLPGSMSRNNILPEVFRDINYAEAKGTGISTLRDEMRNANLSAPLFESNRISNSFVLTLLPHHLFDKQDIEWLQSFKEYNLTNEEARTLIVIREKGSISNSEYRAINGVDTLAASSHLRKLRDFGLLEQKGRGNTTYYTPTCRLLTPGITPGTPGITPGTPGITPGTPGITQVITGIPQDFPPLPQDLINTLKTFGKRTSTKKISDIIKQLCAIAPLTLPDLVVILQRNPDHIRKRYLSKMIENEELQYLYPNIPFHPQQAYKAKRL